MKTRLLALALTGLLIGFTTQAQEDTKLADGNSIENTENFRACINQYPDDIVEFRVEKSDNDVVWFLIEDEDGLLMYKRKIRKHNLAEVDCDISLLPDGKYNYIIERNGEEYLTKTMVKGSDMKTQDAMAVKAPRLSE